MKLIDWLVLLGVSAVIANIIFGSVLDIQTLKETYRHNLQMEQMRKEFNAESVKLGEDLNDRITELRRNK